MGIEFFVKILKMKHYEAYNCWLLLRNYGLISVVVKYMYLKSKLRRSFWYVIRSFIVLFIYLFKEGRGRTELFFYFQHFKHLLKIIFTTQDTS